MVNSFMFCFSHYLRKIWANLFFSFSNFDVPCQAGRIFCCASYMVEELLLMKCVKLVLKELLLMKCVKLVLIREKKNLVDEERKRWMRKKKIAHSLFLCPLMTDLVVVSFMLFGTNKRSCMFWHGCMFSHLTTKSSELFFYFHVSSIAKFG
jgi:hypothetical protein